MPFTQRSTGIAYLTVSNTTGPIDLTGAQVTFIAKKSSGDQEKFPVVIVDAATGKCMAPLSDTFLSESGTYEYQLKIVYEDGTIQRTKMNTFFVDESLEEPTL